MENMTPTPESQGETTDVNEWLSRAGLRFEDLGNDAISAAIRQQWRQYQAAVRRLCIITHQLPELVLLSGTEAKLRIPQIRDDSHVNNSVTINTVSTQ